MRARKKEVSKAKILRVRVARLSWAFDRSGTTVGDVVDDADGEFLRRLKMRILTAQGKENRPVEVDKRKSTKKEERENEYLDWDFLLP